VEEGKADVNKVDNNGWTPLKIAKLQGIEKKVEQLRERVRRIKEGGG